MTPPYALNKPLHLWFDLKRQGVDITPEESKLVE
jgi:hypothetical protein